MSAFRRGTSGHLIIEVAIALVCFSVIAGSAFAVLSGQRRFYQASVRSAAAEDAARIALQALSAELRSVSPGLGDLYAGSADSVALRSTSAVGVVCHTAGETLHVWQLSGAFSGSAGDSVLVFTAGSSPGPADPRWVASGIAGAHARERCADGSSPAAELVLSSGIRGVRVGAPVRAFRPYVYGLYRAGAGDWWLGQRRRDGRFQPITGPFAPPDSGGLRFQYQGSDGAASAQLGEVRLIRITVKALSPGPLTPAGELVRSLSTLVHPRNARSRGLAADSGTSHGG
jgi:hypothetical protein